MGYGIRRKTMVLNYATCNTCGLTQTPEFSTKDGLNEWMDTTGWVRDFPKVFCPGCMLAKAEKEQGK